MSDDGRQGEQRPNVLDELARAKVLFQLRAIEAIIAAGKPTPTPGPHHPPEGE